MTNDVNNLAPAAQIIAGLSSEALLDRMCAALVGVDVMKREERYLAYARAGLQFVGYSAEEIAAADNGAKISELSKRVGRTA